MGRILKKCNAAEIKWETTLLTGHVYSLTTCIRGELFR